MNKDGDPLTWQHYIYGLVHIARERERQQLWFAQAMRMSNTVQGDWDTWQNDITMVTGVPRHG